jgi:1-pyrroline-5-carboxylate dehydrogenase
MSKRAFKLTYATMYNPPEELHTNYEVALEKLRAQLGSEYGMFIDGKDVFADEKFENRSPIDTDLLLGVFQKGNESHAQAALAAARKAAKTWNVTPWQERVALLRKAAGLIDERVYTIGAAISLEAGKNRMEAIADIAETADLMRYACDQMEKNNGFIVEMEKDPIVGYTSINRSILKPYGVWLVISPFNYPAALAGGPVGAALVTGNTVVLKPSTDTPWTSRFLVEIYRDAGLPDGAVNYVTGPGSTLGQALIESDEVDGITFTGSYDVGMKIYRTMANGKYPRPTILEMGGKNPTVVSRHADLERATQGIVRSAFGLGGQKCSAGSRVLAEEPVYDELVARLVAKTKELVLGDPCEKATFLGPVINEKAFNDYQKYIQELSKAGELLVGGRVVVEGDFEKGYYVEPTIVVKVPRDHYLWKHEMFVPITMIQKVKGLDEAIDIANDVKYGLTAGFYGTEKEVEWYFQNIQAGVVYANRPHGSTTGAWPGFQPFGGWKGSGSTGKNAGGLYYLQNYMHEQINNLIK